MNTVTWTELQLEVGIRGMVEVALFRNWLLIEDVNRSDWAKSEELRLLESMANKIKRPSEPQPRIAPSIVTRSEAELFGVSWPRFAIRVGLGEGFFINTRRVASLCSQVEHWQQKPSLWNDILNLFSASSRQHPAHILRFSRAIADAVLNIPHRLKEYDIITAPLGKASGECHPDSPDTFGTVYARHIRAGGGLCAQAACFMATALLPCYARAVHGVAEVTALARNQGKFLDEMNLSGLTPTELQSYFQQKELGLYATWQVPTIGGDVDLSNLGGDILISSSVSEELCLGLESYVGSGFPVIYAVDVGRMAGVPHPVGIYPPPHFVSASPNVRHRRTQDPLVTHLAPKSNFQSIFSKNGLDHFHKTQFKPGKSYAHAVVVLGMQKSPPWRKDREFIFHDPLNFPYMRATACDLLLCGPYSPGSGSVVFGAFLPVVPARVKMPMLASCMPTTISISTLGLLDICQAVQSGLTDTPAEIPAEALPQNSREMTFRLVHWCKNRFEPWLYRLPSEVRNSLPDSLLDSIQQKLLATKQSDQWLWIQWSQQSIWLWKAEMPPPSDLVSIGERGWEYVLALGWFSPQDPNQTVVWVESKHPEKDSRPLPHIQPPVLLSEAKPLKFGFITSLSAVSLDASLSAMPKSVDYCEIYAFMHGDAKLLMRSSDPDATRKQRLDQAFAEIRNLADQDHYPSPGVDASAMERMAKIEQTKSENEVERIAKAIRAKVLKQCRTAIKIGALASYLPGLAQYEGPSVTCAPNRDALSASIFLIRLAAKLRELGEGDLDVIEMVAGSLVQGIRRPRIGDDESDFCASVLGEAAAITRLVESCKILVTTLLGTGQPLKIVFEFEPGPLNVLGTIRRLERFAESLENEPELQNHIFLNLDVAHFAFLANAKPEDLSERVKRLFAHAHISSHGRGHFSDAPLEKGRKNSNGDKLFLRHPAEFVDWMYFYQKSGVLASRRMSVELEACRHASFAKISYDNLARYGLPTFTLSEIKNIRSLAKRFREPTDSVSVYVEAQISGSTREQLAAWNPSMPLHTQLEALLVADLNRILCGDCIWDEERFKGTALRADTQELTKTNPIGLEIVRLNRQLIEDAYRQEIAQKYG